MKILVLIHEYPPVGGGGGKVAQDLSYGFASHGHQLRVVTTTIDGIKEVEPTTSVTIERVGSMRRSAFKASLVDMLLFDIAAFFRSITIIKKWKPDLIHAHFAVPVGVVALLLSKLFHIPYVLTIHLGDVPGAVPSKTENWFHWIYPFTHSIYQNASRIVAVSEFTRQLALKHYPATIEVIHNGVDLDALPHRKIVSTSDKPVQLIFAGRFTDQKNPEHLVEALARIKDLNWRCNMLGDGPLFEKVRSMITTYGMDGKFNLAGWVTPGQVLEAFRDNQILILPSSSEGLSVVGVQALSMGLVMVLSNAGGNPELVWTGQNGDLFEVGDIETLTGLLEKYITDSDLLRNSMEKSLEYSQRFSLDRIVDQYETIFQSVIGKRS